MPALAAILFLNAARAEPGEPSEPAMAGPDEGVGPAEPLPAGEGEGVGPAVPAPTSTADSAPKPPATILDSPVTPGGWIVVSDTAQELDTSQVARLIGDTETTRTLRRGRTTGWIVDGVLLAGALGLGTTGFVLWAQAGPAIDVGAQPDPDAYYDWSAWDADDREWRTRLDRADARDEQVWTAATLLSGAVLCGALIPLTGNDAAAKARYPALVYDRASLSRQLNVAVGPAGVTVTGPLP